MRRRLKEVLPNTPIEFDFVDGKFPSSPAPGIDGFFEGPYYAHYTTFAAQDLADAHDWLSQLIKDRGPYDGVIGFSQGCALTATFLLSLQSKIAEQDAGKPGAVEIPFKFAILICGGVPLTFLEDQGYEVSDIAKENDKRTGLALASQASFSALLEHGRDRWKGDAGADPSLADLSSLPLDEVVSADNIGGLDFRQIPSERLIQIPTVHICGTKDPRKLSGIQLARLCRADRRQVWDHGGGHDIPWTSAVSDKIARLIAWVISPNASSELSK